MTSCGLKEYREFIRRQYDLCERRAIFAGPDRYPKQPGRIFKHIYFSDTLPVAVILGQDPYPQKDVATGIAFANAAGTPLSPSLKVIKDSVLKVYPGEFDQTLVSWVNQGILLLNSAFTVKENTPGSDSLYWAYFTSQFLSEISKMFPNLCYVLLGTRATFFANNIQDSGLIIKEMHPSFYARTKREFPSEVWKKMVDYVEQTFNLTVHLTNDTKGQRQDNPPCTEEVQGDF